MINQGLTISDISRLVGYDDTVGFSENYKEKIILPI